MVYRRHKTETTPQKNRKTTMQPNNMNKVKYVLIQDMSRQMRNKRDMIKIAGVPVPKCHLTCTCIHAARSRLTCIDNHPNYLYKYTFMITPKFVQQIPLKDYQVSMHMPTMCHLPNKFGNDFLEHDTQYFASFINI